MILIEKNSALYLRRLVRQLNSSVDGFYASVATFRLKCNRARLRNGVIECHSLSAAPSWFVPAHTSFDDPYGREIVASLKP